MVISHSTRQTKLKMDR